MPEPAFETVILAGGRALRLGGADKPALTVGGESLLGSVIAAAAGSGAQRVIVVGPARPQPGAGPASDPGIAPSPTAPPVTFVQEAPAQGGPGPALRRGLREVSAPVVVLLAADLPFLAASHVRWLRSALSGEPHTAGVVMLDDGGQPQWLTSCWRAGRLGEAATAYRGKSLHRLLMPLEAVQLRYRLTPSEPPPWFDCDTPQDLARARAMHKEAASEHAGAMDGGGLHGTGP